MVYKWYLDVGKMLNWDKTDFIECLGVEPTEDEYEEGYHFRVDKDGLTLKLSVYHAGDIWISLDRDGVDEPVFNMTIYKSPLAKFVKDMGKEYIEIAPGDCFSSRCDELTVIPYGVKVSVNPSIKVEMFYK
ncbi:MAG: Ypar14, superfamily integron cassette [Planctomycetota bacterium]|jgi:hypothetical protein